MACEGLFQLKWEDSGIRLGVTNKLHLGIVFILKMMLLLAVDTRAFSLLSSTTTGYLFGSGFRFVVTPPRRSSSESVRVSTESDSVLMLEASVRLLCLPV